MRLKVIASIGIILSLTAAGAMESPFASCDVPRLSLLLNPSQPLCERGEVVLPSGNYSDEDTLTYGGDPDRGVSINGTYSYGAAQRFTLTEAVKVKAVLYYLTENADDILVHISAESTTAQPGAMLDSVRASGGGGGIWRRANLPHPPSIPANEDFWTCVIVRRHPSGQHPLTVDLGPMVPWRGGYITLPSIGPTWYQLTDGPFWTDRNWCICAVVEYESGVRDVPEQGRADDCRVTSNPSRGRAEFRYSVREPGKVSLRIYDLSGALVRTLVSGRAEPGQNRTTWDGRNDAGDKQTAGAYVYCFSAEGRLTSGLLTILD
jgi:hypothetical protein